MRLKKALHPATLALMIGGSILLTSCGENKSNADNNKIPPVAVKIFQTQPLNYTIKTVLPARVVASQIAEIRPQVSGIILKREFDESSNVTEGQSLYQIDPAIYQATYDSAVASVASAEANANIAHLTLKRYEGLLKTKSISQQDYDKAQADSQQADAAVLVAKANLHTAKVNLDYTKVYSPIQGYIGKSNVTEGALVNAGQQTPMALVQKLDPIYVDMTQAATIFERNEKDRDTLYKPAEKVELFFNDGSKYEYNGSVKFSDKTVNETTGTVTLRAEFANPNSKILPGMFVKPHYTLGNIENAILVPQKGITSNQLGNYTAIIAIPMNNTAGGNEQQAYYLEQRNNVKVYSGIPGYWIVTSGINAGEKVVISGLLNLAGRNLNDPKNKTIVNIMNIKEPDMLSQKQLDTIIENNLK
ncbi:efflux RND transporter periplasmic adaptor subunit [Frischella sp. Ac48]|uniref:efflux RND transporter periplasmic adaptor subunit n=1 Tax=Frischella sp. Ac48 TaxID=2804531 RepID=UPI001C7DA856|nr:efflux RND transporter periplasmic adaptor subunit [Frischella sp. Ac48]MBX4133407.1 efflux RND transporter periplasmic adaptor subunit [Frischella sp. Ac48]